MQKKVSAYSRQRMILYQGDYIRFVKHRHWEFVERHNCTGIVIVAAMTKDKKVIFISQYRPPVGKKVIEFPAGLVNDLALKRKETLLMAAKRELLEEAGYRAKKMQTLFQGPISAGLTSDLVTLVLALDVQKVAVGKGDASEMIEAIYEVPLKNVDRWLQKMQQKGYLIEPKIYAGLYFLKQIP